jgi:DNA-binding transcriptional MerR regulator/predicted enzyme related to lactoylglutathione lyase
MADSISIGRFSELTGLSVKTIRLYGSMGLLPPSRVDGFTGYRYYDVAQVQRARTIARLRGAGISLREIAGFIDNPRPRQIDEWESGLDAEMSRRREDLNAVRRMLAGDAEAEKEIAMVQEEAQEHTHSHGPRHFAAAAPVLQVPDVVAAAEYYRDMLGFEISFVWGEPPQYATTRRDDAPIHFTRGELPARERGPAADIYLFVSDIDEVFEELKGRGAKITAGLETWPYGMREFVVEDLNGYHLCLGEGVEET